MYYNRCSLDDICHYHAATSDSDLYLYSAISLFSSVSFYSAVSFFSAISFFSILCHTGLIIQPECLKYSTPSTDTRVQHPLFGTI